EDEQVTYAELNRKANRFANRLRGMGVKPDERVAICMERGVEMIVAMLATFKAGAAYVPLDPAQPGSRLAYMLEDCAPVVILTHAATHETLRGIPVAAPILEFEDSPDNPDRVPEGADAGSLAYIVYTSGSTGRPKGVMVEHRSLVNLIGWHLGSFD